MSHVTTKELFIDDLEALDQACQNIGTIELVRNQTTYKWYGQWVKDYHADDAAYKNGIDPKDYGKCEHAIRVKGNGNAYEVGVVRDNKGKLRLVWDLWAGGRGLEAAIGKDASVLRSEYNVQVGMKEMRKKGFRVERKVNKATGRLQMRAWRNV